MVKIFFNRANNTLKELSKGQIKRWRDRVRVVPQWQRLIEPSINERAEEAIYDALLKGNQLTVKYKGRGADSYKKRIVNPLGMGKIIKKYTISIK